MNMGWKASCLFFTTQADGYFGTFPQHHPEFAVEIIKELGLGTFEERGEAASLERGIYPMDKRIYIGAYDQAAVITAKWVSEEFLNGKTPELIGKIEAAMPGAKALAIGLNEVTNFFGYAWFESGKLVRCQSGSADGMAVREGKPLEVEKPLLAKLNDREGQSYYIEVLDGEPTEHAEEDMGEDLVFEVAKLMLGCRLDEFKMSKLAMESYRPKAGLMGRLFRRG